MIIGIRDHKFLTIILATILAKIEGQVFIPEIEAVTLDPDTTISMIWDDDRIGWRVTLNGRTPSEADASN